MIPRLLLALADRRREQQLRSAMGEEDVIVSTLPPGGDWWQRLRGETCDVLVLNEKRLPTPRTAAVAQLVQLPERPSVVILAASKGAEDRAAYLTAGAEAVVDTVIAMDSLTDVLRAVLRRRQDSVRRQLAARDPLGLARLSDFDSQSETMRAFMDVVRRVTPSSTSLLVLGETGVGKERLARAIHAESLRSAGPFVAINCGALPETLLESELFGHEEGAFTGATRARRGCFELAHGGTLFLDEVGEIPAHLQVKLLRALQEHEIRRLGGERTLSVDVRVVAATNADLEADVATGRFRRDLFYRLGVVTLTVPSLRERPEDIPDLVARYLQYLRPRVGRDVTDVSAQAIAALCRYAWPGNVRELVNVLERGMLLARARRIRLEDLPDGVRGHAAADESNATGRVVALRSAPPTDGKTLAEVRKEAAEHAERLYLDELLRASRGRVGETAERAGIGPRALYDRMRYHGLRKEDYRGR